MEIVDWCFDKAFQYCGLPGAYMGFWRARSGHMVHIYDLVVEELFQVVFTVGSAVPDEGEEESQEKMTLSFTTASGGQLDPVQMDVKDSALCLEEYVTKALS